MSPRYDPEDQVPRHASKTRACPRCMDPLPVDGVCDCMGDPDRDYVLQARELHTVTVTAILRTGDDAVVCEVWA